MILHGAKALALPLKLGQSLRLLPSGDKEILRWNATRNDQTWFECEISLAKPDIHSCSDIDTAENLLNMLRKILELNPVFSEQLAAFDVQTELEFNPAFGFGSSSTLTYLLAQWANIDAMQYHFLLSKGSGYDVACAGADAPIIYELLDDMPVIETVEFRPPFADNLWFVYLGRKQETSRSVASFLNNYKVNKEDIAFFSGLTCEFVNADSLETFMDLMQKHEKYLASLLDEQPLGEKRFSDLEGRVKSLGAWGGDFALFATPWNEERLEKYLSQKGITHYFNYNELVF